MRAATQSDGKSTSRKSGDNSEEVTPVPISNTVVKLLSADDTWWEAAWESRTLPVFVLQNIFTIQRKDGSHAVFFHFGNVSTFRKYGFLRSSMRHRRKEGNHETCRAAPARYMDVAGFCFAKYFYNTEERWQSCCLFSFWQRLYFPKVWFPSILYAALKP